MSDQTRGLKADMSCSLMKTILALNSVKTFASRYFQDCTCVGVNMYSKLQIKFPCYDSVINLD